MAFYRYDPTERPDPDNVGTKPGMDDRELQEARRLAGIDNDRPTLHQPEPPPPPAHFKPEQPAELSEEVRRLSGLAPREYAPPRAHTGAPANPHLFDEAKKAAETAAKKKKVTKATAKSVVKKHAKGLDTDHIEIDSDMVTIWLTRDQLGDYSATMAVKRKAQAIAKELGGSLTYNGSKFDIRYKGVMPSKGDYTDKGSRWHY